jgi:tetratricopeptide (TPR) repeat protein
METWRTFSAPGMLFLANAIVLLENVVPAYVIVGSERIANDGMILAQILFRPLMPALTTKRALRFGARALNVAELLLFSVPAIGCVVVTGFFLSQAEWTGMPRLMRTLAALVGMLAIYFGYLAVWRAKQPAKVEQESSFGTPARRGFNELAEQSRCLKDRAAAKILRRLIATESAEEKFAGVNKLLDQFPDDWFLMYLRGASLYELNRHGEAEVVFKNIQQLNIPSLARFSIAAAQVQCLVRAGERKRAESICEEWFTGTAPFEQKTCMVDAFVSIHLYCEQLDDLTFLEKWARRAIELDPNNAAMKETLGGVLVEAGRYAEAEPLLLPQVEGESSTTSKAFAMFYLGLIKAARGDQREAAKMIERATIWSRQKWLLKRAQAKLVELRSSQASVRA